MAVVSPGVLMTRERGRVGAAPPPTLLLDTISISATAAYSFRKIRGAYAGNAVQVQRASDSAVQNIGFVGNNFDVASYNAFIGASTGSVSIWYDQSGNGYDLTVGTAPNPAINLTGLNGHPTSVWAGAGVYMFHAAPPTMNPPQTLNAVVNRTGDFSNYNGFVGGHGGAMAFYYSNAPNGLLIFQGGSISASAPCNDSYAHSNTCVFNGASSIIYTDGNAGTGVSTGFNPFTGTRLGFQNGGFTGDISEAIFWVGILTAGDLTTLASNQNSYYGMKLVDKINSVVPGAAYSFRKIVGGYTGPAMNVMRASDSATQDIGFTPAGDFDSAAFTAFIGGSSGLVNTWYDQSINGNHATGVSTPLPVVNLTGLNGRPTAVHTTPGRVGRGTTPALNQPFTLNAVAERTSGFSGYGGILGNGTGSADGFYFNSAPNGVTMYLGGTVPAGVPCNDSAAHSLFNLCNGATSSFTVDGTTTIASANPGPDNFAGIEIGYSGAAAAGTVLNISEAIAWNGQLSAGDLAAVTTDQESYYRIRLVDKLNSVAPVAAYSLRRVVGGYTGAAVNIRRLSDNATQDIGFTATGDFDVASFSAFVGASTGVIATWYDQTINASHATAYAADVTHQPRLGLGATVNGRPAALFDQSGTGAFQGLTAPTAANPAGITMGAVASRTGNLAAHSVFLGYDGNAPALDFNNAVDTVTIGVVNVSVIAPVACTNNAFHSIVGWQDASNNWSLWSDNGTPSTGTITASTGNTHINLAGQNGYPFIGSIAEAFIWDGKISAADIATMYADQHAYYG